MEVAILLVFFVLLIGGVFIAPKLKTEIGILMMILAFIVGRWGYGLSTKEIAGLLPADLVIIVLSVNLFFGYARKAGLTDGLVDRILYMTKGNTKWLPFMIIVADFVLTSLGAGAYGAAAILSPIVFTLVADVGLNPLLGVASMFLGSSIGMWPWTEAGSIAISMIDNMVAPGTGFSTQLWSQVCALIVIGIFYIVLYAITRKKVTVDHMVVKQPVPFTPEQKKILGVLAVIIVLLIVPMLINSIVANPVTAWMVANLEVRVLFLLGALVLGLMNLGKAREIVSSVPWGLILMLCGTTMFVGLAQVMGVDATLIHFISNAIPSWLIVPALLIVGGLIGMFVNGFVVMSTFLPMAASLGELAGVSPYAIGLAIGICVVIPAFSPFSTGGAVCLMGCADDTVREKLIPKQFACSLILLFAMGVFGLTGFFKLF